MLDARERGAPQATAFFFIPKHSCAGMIHPTPIRYQGFVR
jgi:hypothetical protein